MIKDVVNTTEGVLLFSRLGNHCDAVCRANGRTETTTVAHGGDLGGTGGLVEDDAGIPSIHASNLATPTVEAERLVDAADNLDGHIKLAEVCNLLQHRPSLSLHGLGNNSRGGGGILGDNELVDDDGLSREGTLETLFNLHLFIHKSVWPELLALAAFDEEFRGADARPCLQLWVSTGIEEELETRDQLMRKKLEALVHRGRAELDSRGTTLHEFPGSKSIFSTTASKEWEPRNSLGNLSNTREGEGLDGATRHATIGGLSSITETNLRNKCSVSGDRVEPRDGVHTRDT